MKELLIQKYVDMLSKDDILKFARMNNVELCNNEVDIIYNVIKKDWKNIVYGDYRCVLDKYRCNFSVDKLNKMEDLIVLYKDKYKKYI